MSETRVLLVEDEPGYALFLREVLLEDTATDYRFTVVETLGDAVVRLGEGTFDIVLLDLGLPDADGTEALLRISQSSLDIPIVVLSALSEIDVAIESMRLGAQEYLVKGQSEVLLLSRAIRYAIERKRLQALAAASQIEAERASAVKDEFLAMLGHELRNPLVPIVVGLNLIRKHGYAPIARELEVVERQVDHVVRLVDDLLDVSRLARGKMTLHRSRADVADFVAAGVETARPLLLDRTLSLTVPRGALFVDGDPLRLAQVVANLLTNAGKYTHPGGTIAVSARADGGFVELRVGDDGIGMSPELVGRVFDLFEQGARSLDRAAGGLGLGLAIVRSIVGLHGGSVTAASDGLEKGSELVVRLPRQAGAEAPVERAVEPAAPPAPVGARRVLIVDDNEDGVFLLVRGLAEMGYTAKACKDGPSALAAAPEFRADVALIDIGLPGMNGYEVARRMRALLGDRTPTLLSFTGYGQDADRARAAEARFDMHVVKPISLADLAKVIASLPSK